MYFKILSAVLAVCLLFLALERCDAQAPPGECRNGLIVPCPNPNYEVPDYVGSYPDVPTWRGWLFRRYAGSVEMQTKTVYPKSYHGTYVYRGWRPDWINPSPFEPRELMDGQRTMPLPHGLHGPIAVTHSVLGEPGYSAKKGSAKAFAPTSSGEPTLVPNLEFDFD